MSLVSITPESLAANLGKEVPESYLLIAKNSVLGLGAEAIAEILGVEISEVQEIESNDDYKAVRLTVAALHNQGSIDRDLSWDELERLALGSLIKRVSGGNLDTDTNLRIAAVANRAQRRHLPTNQPLDAQATGRRVGITLTKRVIERLTEVGAERETIQEISVRNGGLTNPTFSEIDQMLGVTSRAKIPSNFSFKVSEPEEGPDLDPADLDSLLEDDMRKRRK